MEIYDQAIKNGVQIQIKPLDKSLKSKSFTIHNTNAEEVYNRVFFLFERLSESEGNITIIHYKTKGERNETGINE